MKIGEIKKDGSIVSVELTFHSEAEWLELWPRVVATYEGEGAKIREFTLRIRCSSEEREDFEACGGVLPEGKTDDDGSREITAVVQCGVDDITTEFQSAALRDQIIKNGASEEIADRVLSKVKWLS
jgi:hypothetical protein